MKTFLGFFGVLVLLGVSGCAIEPAYPAGASVDVYGEYPSYYYGGGYYYPYRYHGGHRWHHPYDRDRYFYRPYRRYRD